MGPDKEEMKLIRAFAESGYTLGEGPFPLVEAFAERKPSAKVTRCTACR
jgi:hypothetical protein